ncbi:hypothetical protein LLG46_11860 [bacterium]|nr:hypothetical protein [bacterium]
MHDHIGGVNWFYAFRVFSALLLTVVMGAHSYYRYVQESAKVVSARKLMYWLYSAVFLVASITNFVLLVLLLATGSYGGSPSHIGVFTLLLVFSYIALLVGAHKNPYK